MKPGGVADMVRLSAWFERLVKVIKQPEPELVGNQDALSLSASWRAVLLVVIPFGALAFAVGWVLDPASGQSNALDRIAYPSLTIALLVIEGALGFNKISWRFAVLAIVIGGGAFLLIKLYYILFLASPPVNILAEMTESFFWIPIIYLVSFLLPGLRWGRFTAILFSASTCVISLVFIVLQVPTGENLEAVYALIQLNLANATLLVTTLAFIKFKERYTETHTRVETMERFAYTDLLTELPNRRLLADQLQKAIALARQQTTKLAIFFIDLDRFKLVNDTLGHETGDLLLKLVAQRLSASTRESDTLARISGDEFILIARGLKSSEDVMVIAHKTRAALASPFKIKDHMLTVTASIGISLYPDDGEDVTTLLRHADSAMYYVKKLGRNGFHSFNLQIYSEIEERNELERDLQGALERREFILHYQPQYDLKSGALVKIEALLRWQHCKRGLIPPGEFIPLAEKSGLITAIGLWVLQEACHQNVAWQRLGYGEFKVAVNVSPLQFAQLGFYDSVTQALEQSGLAPSWLELELTENIVMENVEVVARSLGRLQGLGVGLAIDDFGTGYSSLAYLRDLPIDTVKIDRSFINDLKTPRESPQYALALIQAIISLAQNLDLDVVAEGIESKAQLHMVRELGCHIGQGNLLAKAMEAHEVQDFLKLPPVLVGQPLST